MKRINVNHLLCATKHSLPLLFASVSLSILAFSLSYYIGNSNTAMVLLLGIVGSIISLAISEIISKYRSSVDSLESLQCNARMFHTQVCLAQETSSMNDREHDFYFSLWCQYNLMCLQSKSILYRKSSRQILCAIASVLKSIREASDISVVLNELENAIE